MYHKYSIYGEYNSFNINENFSIFNSNKTPINSTPINSTPITKPPTFIIPTPITITDPPTLIITAPPTTAPPTPAPKTCPSNTFINSNDTCCLNNSVYDSTLNMCKNCPIETSLDGNVCKYNPIIPVLYQPTYIQKSISQPVNNICPSGYTLNNNVCVGNCPSNYNEYYNLCFKPCDTGYSFSNSFCKSSMSCRNDI